MKISVFKSVTLFALLVITACTQDIKIETTQTINDSNAINQICITGKDFQIDDDTRSSVAIGDSGASFAWDEDDVIGIFPDKGDQVSFAMEQGAGTQTAIFSGGGWALKSSAKYAAYYPHVYENRDVTKIPVSYVGQTQNGNANTDHIGAYDFMAASVTTPSNGAVAFDMQHLGALVQLTVTVPEPSTLTKVVLTSTTEFTQTGTIDLTAEIPAITAVTQSNTLDITLNNVTTTEANEKVIVYFMMAPVDLTDSELTATTYYVNETSSEIELTMNNLQPGKAYRFTEDVKSLNDYIDEYGINHGEGVEIDGVVWAPVNCGYHATDFKYGKLYQWGRKYGQGYSDDNYSDAIAPVIESSTPTLEEAQSIDNQNVYYNGSSDWYSGSRTIQLWNEGTEDTPIKSSNDPCPTGWRVPTKTELYALTDNHSEFTQNTEGQYGYYFSGSRTYSQNTSQIFLPAAGWRNYGNAYMTSKNQYRDEYGCYYSSTLPENSSYRVAFTIDFGSDGVDTHPNSAERANAFSVRCVKE